MITEAIRLTLGMKPDSYLLISDIRCQNWQNPFIFPSQATQVFYSDDSRKEGWKVVLRSEAWTRREVLDTSDVFISTTVEIEGLTAPDSPPPLPGTAIELLTEENLLATTIF
jgi:hypothetical protein